MRRTLTGISAMVMAGALALAGAAAANAATRSGSISCTYDARIVSTTTGFTQHSFTAVGGAVRSSSWASGGYHSSLGYPSGTWKITATTITNGSAVC